MNRPNGSIHESANLLNKASQKAPWDNSIKHSIAENRLKYADIARTPLEKEKYLKEASEIAFSLRTANTGEAHGYHTLVKIGLRRLRDLIKENQGDPPQAEFENCVKEIERNLSEGFQRFPDDSYLLDAESQLASLLSDSDRVLDALKKAVATNPRSTFISLRLARCFSDRGDSERAEKTLEVALEANPGEYRLHYAYARLLMESGTATGDKLAYHLQRSFIPGDKNYAAQILYGRQLFINGDREGYKTLFDNLGGARVPTEVRDRLLYPLSQEYQGNIIRIESSYCFILREAVNDWIYIHRNEIEEKTWKVLNMGARVTFWIAFTFRGPNGFKLSVISQ